MSDLISSIKYGFVILHYITYEMTEECVALLLKQFGGYNIHIVIVDNASPNGSGEKLVQRFDGDGRVTVLLNEENSGFAKGNNMGYQYLNEHIHPDYIIVMNNDVLIQQVEFLDLVDEIYRRTQYAVLGPDIYNPPTQSHQSPLPLRVHNIEELRKLYSKSLRRHKYVFAYYCGHLMLDVIRWIKASKDDSGKGVSDHALEQEGVVLHGSCYVFSHKFIDVRSVCFFPGTFLYEEEGILHYECCRTGLKMLYSPQLKVQHLEDVSTDAVSKSAYRKYVMKSAEECRSLAAWICLAENQ